MQDKKAPATVQDKTLKALRSFATDFAGLTFQGAAISNQSQLTMQEAEVLMQMTCPEFSNAPQMCKENWHEDAAQLQKSY